MSATELQAGRRGCAGAIVGGIVGVVLAALLYRYLHWDPALATFTMGVLGAALGARIAQMLAARGRRRADAGRRRG